VPLVRVGDSDGILWVRRSGGVTPHLKRKNDV
jgi:hypothetical protein